MLPIKNIINNINNLEQLYFSSECSVHFLGLLIMKNSLCCDNFLLCNKIMYFFQILPGQESVIQKNQVQKSQFITELPLETIRTIDDIFTENTFSNAIFSTACKTS